MIHALTGRQALEAAANPDLSPLDYFLALMRNEALPLGIRVAMAHKALPYLHSKLKVNDLEKPVPEKEPRSSSGVSVQAKSNSGSREAAANSPTAITPRGGKNIEVMPLDFLLNVMRAPDTPHAIRLKAASITTPYIHKRKTDRDAAGKPIAKPDRYDFVIDRMTARKIRDDIQRLGRLRRTRPKNRVKHKQKLAKLYVCVREQVEKLICPCPSLYGPREKERDKRRIAQLARKRKSRSPLSKEEDAEEAHLYARYTTYCQGPEEKARARIVELEERRRVHEVAWGPPLSTAEENELRGSRALYPKLRPPPVDDVIDPFRFEVFNELVAG